MGKLQINREYLEAARKRAVLDDEERSRLEAALGGDGSNKSRVSIDIGELPFDLLRALLDEPRLTINQRTKVAMQVYGMPKARLADREEIYQTCVENPIEFGSVFAVLGGRSPNCEFFLNGRWYAIAASVDFLSVREDEVPAVHLVWRLSWCDVMERWEFSVARDFFLDEVGMPRSRTVIDVLRHAGLRGLEISPSECNLRLLRAERTARQHGLVVNVKGPALCRSRFLWRGGFHSHPLGTPEIPSKAIVEPELERDFEERRHHYDPIFGQTEQGLSRLPLVRVFSLEAKGYFYSDVDDLEAYEFDRRAIEWLHLPSEILGVLTRVFDTPLEHLYGDLVQGKHGGAVVLACGRPGVGKTLTAEIYAEQTGRPLYVLEIGELGASAGQVEENLQRVFARVTRWNALLQFDECDIFLAQRDTDLQRSAIVGIFLRLLDYYRGILFLTTNRPEALDHAVYSRVMLKVEYPDLDRDARRVIWQNMFRSAGLELKDGTFAELGEAEIDGRQIRNLTRLVRILYPEGAVTPQQVRAVLHYASG